MERDFVGYGRNLPQVRWPNDARIAVSLVVNTRRVPNIPSWTEIPITSPTTRCLAGAAGATGPVQ